MDCRKEKDFLGAAEIPVDAFWGVHTHRAIENFSVSGYKTHPEFIKAFGYVKLACALANNDLKVWDNEKARAIIQACEELIGGTFDDQIKVDALQGGAGTSLNMNVNEVIANIALGLLGKDRGEYSFVDPIEDINLHQSTNDVYPTALKIACILLLRKLEKEVISLQESLQEKEKEFADVVKVGRTQLMDAVLVTLGKEFSAYAEAISRDRWRVYKCEERLRVVNIGGTAVGTGICAPRKYIFGVIDKLRDLTGIGLARAENLIENTQNLDVFSEVSGILKAHATSLIKIANDIRLMNSGPVAGLGEIKIPAVQTGSSIMPGKINPVIPEMVAQVGMKVLGNDVVINQCVAGGQFELNQNTPLIAFSILESLEILINANRLFRELCIDGIQANRQAIQCKLENSYAILNALVPELGYNKVSSISKQIQKTDLTNITIKDFLIQHNYLTEERFIEITSPEAVLSLGYN
jgi:aspartate ammonia-lyase